jgi:predicted DNA-binding transcriptional regulator AlpA
MRVDASTSGTRSMPPARPVPLTISKRANERYPPLNELLSAHDVARLTRRPRWLLAGLCLIGRFPKRLKFRGRGIGWRRSEVLDWMSRDLAIARDNDSTSRACVRKHPRQACLPLDRATSSSSLQKRPRRRERKAVRRAGDQA